MEFEIVSGERLHRVARSIEHDDCSALTAEASTRAIATKRIGFPLLFASTSLAVER
jgi:hypothetical protein